MSNITVLVMADPAHPALKELDAIGPGVTVKIGKTAADLGDAVAEASVLFNWTGAKTEVHKVLQTAPKLEWIHAMYAGLDRSLFPELVEHPVPLTNGSGVFSQSLGEFIMLGVLYWAKDVPRRIAAKSARRWDVFDNVEISTQAIGIVGHGDIGRAVSSRAKAMGMRVLALRRNTERRAGDEHVDRVYGVAELHEMLPECDYVAVAAPLTAETKGMIGKAEFEKMKPSAIIMNVGRGPVIDEPAMIDALRTKRIRGAALDVFDIEPLPPDSPFWDLENVFMTAHCADHVHGWVESAVVFFIEQFNRWRKGEPLKNIVDKRAGY
jgi:phosphoglycerate dehydrogenase-like enzyme